MPSAPTNDEWDLPRLKASIGFEDDYHYLSADEQDTEFFDVKFYPYAAADHDPVFAAVSKKHVVIYRLSHKTNPSYELVQLLRDDDEDALNCSCTWTKNPETEVPYLCVAGRDAKIKVYDVVEGRAVKVLVGHGGEINDLTTSPTNFLLIASASEDTTVRIWSLDPADADSPCVCLLAGEGHASGLLTCAFHSNGQYILSAGHDNAVCMWAIPELPIRSADGKPSETPHLVHFPHFYTSEVHSGIVDCVAFFGDLILSRACHEDIIVLWQIDGFSSRDKIPSASEAPTASDAERLTRSAFTPGAASQYTRLLQFATPNCGHQFYLRFKLYHNQGKHPVLAFGSAHSDIYFWDLNRLIKYHEFMESIRDQSTRKKPQQPSWLQAVRPKAVKDKVGPDPVSKLKDGSDKDSILSGRTGSMDLEMQSELTSNFTPETLERWNSQYDATNQDDAIKAHATSKITIKDFVGRQVAWSAGGEWCVVVGSKNLAIILQRWEKRDKVEEGVINPQH